MTRIGGQQMSETKKPDWKFGDQIDSDGGVGRQTVTFICWTGKTRPHHFHAGPPEDIPEWAGLNRVKVWTTYSYAGNDGGWRKVSDDPA